MVIVRGAREECVAGVSHSPPPTRSTSMLGQAKSGIRHIKIDK